MADFIGEVLLVSGVFIVGGLLGLMVGASLHRQSVNPEKEQEESERIYDCGCGLTMDRDLNAAINIKNFAI